MFTPTKIYFIVFGLLTIAGGTMGYVKAGSTISLIAGAISGILLLVAAFLLPGQVVVGLLRGPVFTGLYSQRKNDAGRDDVASEHPRDRVRDRRLDP